jgi:DNA gyrase subunit A
MVKKSALTDLPGPSSQSFTLAKVNPGDFLGWVVLTTGSDEVMLFTAGGMGIRFSEQEVRPMGLVAAGVNGIKLDARDEVVAVDRIAKGIELLLLASTGQAWRIPAEDFPVQGRYGQGVIACRLSAGVKLVGEMSGKRTQTGTIHFERAASQNIRLDEIPLGKRAVASKNPIPVKAGDAIIQLTVPVDGVAFWAVTKPEAEKKSRSSKPKEEKKPDSPKPEEGKKPRSTTPEEGKKPVSPKPEEGKKPRSTKPEEEKKPASPKVEEEKKTRSTKPKANGSDPKKQK